MLFVQRAPSVANPVVRRLRMFPKNLLLFLLLAPGAAHTSSVSRDTGKATLKFSTEIDAAGFDNLVEKDRARAQALRQLPHFSERSISRRSVSATNAAVFYTAEVGVGTPPTYHTLLIDTGSSNTWIGASSQYVPTNSSVNTGGTVFVAYGSGAFYGEEWLDTVTLTSDLVIHQQSIGVANWTNGTSGFDGILGLGPIDLTIGTVSNALEVPTVTDNLHTQKRISQEVLGVFFSPASEARSNGELMFGGYDNSVITSSVNYVPLTSTFPASEFWGIDQSISYGGTTILSSTAGIVDTGTTLILIATDAFQQYQSLTGAILDSATGLLTITLSQYANLQTLSFNIGGTSYDLIPNAQIWPRSLNYITGGNSSSIYLVVNDIGFRDELFFDFINGYSFLYDLVSHPHVLILTSSTHSERYYSIFDTSHHRFGIAKTSYTDSNTN
ncbi:acid protease [Butyriboletus roseoflavus]|nr:acid protease [Butyriboletus roseoflavus]